MNADNEGDIRKLVSVISLNQRVCSWLVTRIDNTKLRESARGALVAVDDALDQVKRRLSPERLEEETWQKLEHAGLTGLQLQFKLEVLEALTKRRGFIAQLLRWLNSFLGSLAQAFPLVHVAKEWKDGVALVDCTNHS